MSVRRCQREIDAYEFQEWVEDYAIRRWEHEDDERAAMLAAVVVNSNPWRKSGSAPAKISDFMPATPDDRRPMAEADMKKAFAQAKKAFERKRTPVTPTTTRHAR